MHSLRHSLKGLGPKLCPYFTLFSRMCTTAPYLSSAKACTIAVESDTTSTRPQIHRFRHHRRERRRLEQAFLTNAAATVRSVGAVCGVSEGVCEALTFMEWSTMVVPTYPEGGSHALPVCQHHHQVVRVGRFVRDWKNMVLAAAPVDSAETFTV
jgi:hypothetical protein